MYMCVLLSFYIDFCMAILFTHTLQGHKLYVNPRYDYARSGSQLNCFVHTADFYNIKLFNRLMMAEAVLLQCSVNGCTHYKIVYIAVFLCGCYRAV